MDPKISLLPIQRVIILGREGSEFFHLSARQSAASNWVVGALRWFPSAMGNRVLSSRSFWAVSQVEFVLLERRLKESSPEIPKIVGISSGFSRVPLTDKSGRVKEVP